MTFILISVNCSFHQMSMSFPRRRWRFLRRRWRFLCRRWNSLVAEDSFVIVEDSFVVVEIPSSLKIPSKSIHHLSKIRWQDKTTRKWISLSCLADRSHYPPLLPSIACCASFNPLFAAFSYDFFSPFFASGHPPASTSTIALHSCLTSAGLDPPAAGSCAGSW